MHLRTPRRRALPGWIALISGAFLLLAGSARPETPPQVELPAAVAEIPAVTAAVDAPDAPEAPARMVPEPEWLVAGWRRVLSASDAHQARAALEAIEAGGLARGLRSQQLPALALLRADADALKLSREERINWAIRLGYDSAAVRFAAARASWSVGPLEAVYEYGRAISSLSGDFGYLVGVTSRFVVALALALCLAYSAFSAIMVFKYGPGFVHDLDHFLPVELPLAYRVTLGVGLAGLPLLLGLGWLGTCAVWIFALWGALVKRERIVAAIFLALLAAAYPIATAVAALLPSPESQRFLAATLRVQSGMSLEADRTSLANDAERTDDPIAYFSMGRAAWLAGDTEEGIEAMRKALIQRPGWVPAMNNLAILLLEKGESAEAESLLKGALEREPDNARLLFNLSYLYRREFRLKEAERTYIQARESDARAVDRFTQITGAEGSFIIPATLRYGDLWRKRLNAEPGRALLARNLARPFLGRIPPEWMGPAVMLGFAAALVATRSLEKRGRSGRCNHCGSDVCPACHGNDMTNGTCMPCHQIYIQARPMEARARLAQDQRVMRFRAERRRGLLIAGTILPGLGHLLMDNTYTGTGLLVTACLTAFAPLLLVVQGTAGGLWTPPLAPSLGGITTVLVLGGILAVFILGARDLHAKVRPI